MQYYEYQDGKISRSMDGPAAGIVEVLNEELIPDLARLTQEFDEQRSNMSVKFDTLRTEVSETKTVMGSAKTLIEGLSQRIKDADGDPVELKAITDDLDGSTNDLAAAVAANTPAAPGNPEVPVGG